MNVPPRTRLVLAFLAGLCLASGFFLSKDFFYYYFRPYFVEPYKETGTIPEPVPLPGEAHVFATPAPDNREGWLKLRPAEARAHLNRGEPGEDGSLRYTEYGGFTEWVAFERDGSQRLSLYAYGRPSRGGYPYVQIEVRGLDGTVHADRRITVHAAESTPQDIVFDAPAGPAALHVYYLRGVFDEGKGTWFAIEEVALEHARLLPEAPERPSIKAITDPLIREHRMGTLEVRALPGASVRIEQTRHAFRFGCNIESSVFDEDAIASEDREKLLGLYRTYFNALTPATLYWSGTEKEYGAFNLDRSDRAIGWARENGFYVQAHTVFWGSDVHGRITRWQKEMGDNQLRRVIRRRGYQIASRYKGQVDLYDFNNEMVHHRYFRSRLGEITYDMVSSMLAADPDARLATNEFNIITLVAIDRYIALHEKLLAEGVPLHAIGLQARVNGDIRFEHAWEAFERMSRFGLPLNLTELDFEIPDPRRRARALERLMRIGFAHPNVHGMTIWGIWEPLKWLPDAALWDEHWNRLPPGDVLHRLLREEWWTQWEGTADAGGTVSLPAFYGEYLVTVDGEPHEVSLSSDAGTVLVDAR